VSKGLKILIIILVVLSLGLVGYVAYAYYLHPKTAPSLPDDSLTTSSPSPTASPTSTSTATPLCTDADKSSDYTLTPDTQNLYKYTNNSANLSFKYSSGVNFNNEFNNEQTGLRLSVKVSKVECMNGTIGFDSENALKDRTELEKGEIGERFDWPVGTKVIKIGEKYAKTYGVFERFEATDVTFEKYILFYNNDYQILIGLTIYGDSIVKGIIKDYPEYFYKYTLAENVLYDGFAWKVEDDIHDKFYDDLPNTQNSDLKQLNSVFDTVANSIKFAKD
jgi:hypothetical protein